MNTIVGLLSCHAYTERQSLCRRTWIPAVQALGIDVVFLIGGHDRVERRCDELWLPVPDTYRELPQKTIAFCKWAIQSTEATHLFKADDDTFIHPRRFTRFLAELPVNREYVGAEWRPRTRYASGGAGYVLSRRAAELVSKMHKLRGAEDVEVGKYVQSKGVLFWIDRRFVPFGNEQKRPLPTNDLITTHKIPVNLWLDTWELCKGEST